MWRLLIFSRKENICHTFLTGSSILYVYYIGLFLHTHFCIWLHIRYFIWFICFIPLQEECVLSDPQGESDADADIEDTDCRFDVHKHSHVHIHTQYLFAWSSSLVVAWPYAFGSDSRSQVLSSESARGDASARGWHGKTPPRVRTTEGGAIGRIAGTSDSALTGHTAGPYWR